MGLQSFSEHSTSGFAAFALLHARCGDAVVETRLDEGSLACWCVRCGEARVFGSERDWREPRRESA